VAVTLVVLSLLALSLFGAAMPMGT
jgi:hypothetical protein